MKIRPLPALACSLALAALLPGPLPAQSPTRNPAPFAATSVLGRLLPLGADFAIRLPAGWTAQAADGGFMLLPAGVRFDPARTDNPEVYVVTLRDDYDPDEEAATARQLAANILRNGGRGGARQATTFGSRAGAIYRCDFRDPATGRAAAFDIHLATEGQHALVIIAAGEAARVRGHAAALHQILSSLATTTVGGGAIAGTGGVSTSATGVGAPAGPAVSSLADTTPRAQRWLAKLRGRMIHQFSAYSGMSSEKKRWLHADGRYEFRSSSMVSIDVGGASALGTDRGENTGRWSIRDQGGDLYLEVRLNNGRVQRLEITEDNRNWYLNGEKAFAVDQ